MTQRTFLIDFDHTLFDVERFIKDRDEGITSEFSNYLFPDSIPFVKYTQEIGNAILFSEGDVEFQNEKIEKTGIRRLFGENVQVYPSFTKISKMKLYGEPGSVVIVDDKPEVVDEGIKMGYKTIRVRRGRYASRESVEIPTFEVSSLIEIIGNDLLSKV